LEKSHASTDTRLFQLPFLRGTEVTYEWNYNGEEPTEYLFDNSSISRVVSIPFMDNFYLKLGDPVYFRESKYFSNLLAIMDVQYIILHKDEIITSYYQEKVDDTRTYIKNWSGVKHVYNNGELEVYKLNNNLVPGRVYIADKLFDASNLDKTFSLISSARFDPANDAVIIPSENTLNYPDIHLEKPKYTVEKLSDTRYQIKITNSKNPFMLILANNFNDLWSAKIGDQVLNDHYLLNGYANGWLVSKKGSYTVDISLNIGNY